MYIFFQNYLHSAQKSNKKTFKRLMADHTDRPKFQRSLGSLLKTTPPTQGYPTVPRGRKLTTKFSRGSLLDHQVLTEPDAKNL